MAVGLTSLTSGQSESDASSYATASVTPSSDALVLVAVTTCQAGGAPTTPALNGNSLTYVRINGATAGTRQRIDVFRTMGASPTAGAITIDYGGVSQVACAWSVVEGSGCDTTGTNGSGAVVQNAVAADVEATSITVTLAAFASANNATYGAFDLSFVNEDQVPGTGFTELHEVRSATSPARSMEVEWRVDNDTTVNCSSASIDLRGGVAIEISAAAAAAAGVPYQPWMQRGPVVAQ